MININDPLVEDILKVLEGHAQHMAIRSIRRAEAIITAFCQADTTRFPIQVVADAQTEQRKVPHADIYEDTSGKKRPPNL
jgi:hypothetical protein